MTRVRRTTCMIGTATLLLGAGPGGSASAGGDCILGCYSNFEEFDHTAPQAGDFALYEDGWHDTPVEGVCNCGVVGIDPKHPFCNPPVLGCADEEEEDLLSAIANGDAVAIARSLSKYGDAIVAVPERRAVQIVGCNERILAHIPVPDGFFALLDRQ